MTRRTLMRSDVKSLDRALQALPQVDRRPVAEDPLGLAEVGPRVANVAGARGQRAAGHGLAEDLADRVGNAIDACRRAGGDVEDLAVRALCLACADRRVDDVADIRE